MTLWTGTLGHGALNHITNFATGKTGFFIFVLVTTNPEVNDHRSGLDLMIAARRAENNQCLRRLREGHLELPSRNLPEQRCASYLGEIVFGCVQVGFCVPREIPQANWDTRLSRDVK